VARNVAKGAATAIREARKANSRSPRASVPAFSTVAAAAAAAAAASRSEKDSNCP